MTNATTGQDQLQGVAEAAEALRLGRAAAELARHAHRPTSTLTRREHLDLLDWPARDVLRIARAESLLGTPMIDYLAGRQVAMGDPTTLAESLVGEVDSSNAVAITIRTALADGQVRAGECDQIAASLERRMAADAKLLRTVNAYRRTARP
jgi:hypothetical protein